MCENIFNRNKVEITLYVIIIIFFLQEDSL